MFKEIILFAIIFNLANITASYGAEVIINNKTDKLITGKAMLTSQDPSAFDEKIVDIAAHSIQKLTLNVSFPKDLYITASEQDHSCNLKNYPHVTVIKHDNELICYPS